MTVKWFDVNLKWEDVYSLDVNIHKNGSRSILLNDKKYTYNSICKKRPENSYVCGSRFHLFGIDFLIKVDSPKLYKSNYFTIKLNQCKKEFDIWNSVQENDKKFFAEVLDYKENKFIVFKRYNDIHNDEISLKNIKSKHVKKINEIKRKYKLLDVFTEKIGMHYLPFNWCLVNNIPLIYDYGM
jgi:hypothetical protein